MRWIFLWNFNKRKIDREELSIIVQQFSIEIETLQVKIFQQSRFI